MKLANHVRGRGDHRKTLLNSFLGRKHQPAFVQHKALITGLAILCIALGCGGSSTPPPAADNVQTGSQPSAAESAHNPTDERVSGYRVDDSATRDESQLQTQSTATPSTAVASSVSAASAEQRDPSRPSAPQRFRLPDDRPELNAEELLSHGLRMVESKHLVLVTDLPQESVAELPQLADALFANLEARLGKLSPNIAGTEFQVTGFLMDARERFKEADVMPPDEFTIRHGRHFGYQFWINNQSADYYRRHLLLHEFVHCFMSCEYGMNDIPPLWYTEGIAEYFATHRLHTDVTKSQFAMLPTSREGFEGWHRIAEVHRHFNHEPSATGELADIISLQTVMYPPDNTFLEDSQYANAWALVWLINHHPELQPEFSTLATCRTQEQFNDAMAKIPEQTLQEMKQIWPLYLDGLAEAEVATVRFPSLTTMPSQQSHGANTLPLELTLDAGQQWVSTGFELTAGQQVLIECKGRFVVGETTKPWISEPDGITIDYVRGRPLGEVIGSIVSTDGTKTTRPIPIGTYKALQSPIDGILWLQINDQWSDRADNDGNVTVRISPANQ